METTWKSRWASGLGIWGRVPGGLSNLTRTARLLFPGTAAPVERASDQDPPSAADHGLTAPQELVRAVEQALRKLNNPAALARCELSGYLPCTLLQSRPADGPESGDEPSPLDQARWLRAILAAAIDGLKPTDGDHGFCSPAALQYHILHQEYLEGRPNRQIMARLSVSEGTLYRNRRQALHSLADELQLREWLLARDPLCAQHNRVDSAT